MAPHPVPGRVERLDYVLPDFTRVMWTGDTARAVWEPRLQRITRAWLEIEWLAVAAGLRACAVTTTSPPELLRQAGTWVDRDLSCLPVEIQGAGGSYAATPVALEWGKPFAFRLVVGRSDDLKAFRRAWATSDHAAIGMLLGYPPCCLAFFRRVWVDDAMVDTTWPMAVATVAILEGQREAIVEGPAEANILWRWMGVRAVPHLPCRLDCGATVALGRRLVAVGRAAGFEAEMDWLLDILSWPVEWSALHGIAEIKTPILKVSSRTDATPRKYVVQRRGDAYPVEGAKGLRFPYRMPARPLLTSTPGFRRGVESGALADPLTTGRPATEPEWRFRDNGFASGPAMDAAHAPIVALAMELLAGGGGTILDLGCGNGALLQRIQAACPGVVPVGVDADPGRIAHARTLHAANAAEFVVGDLLDSEAVWPPDRRYRLVLLMPGRLVEADPDRAERLRRRLRTSCDQVLAYAYGDWLLRYGGLRGLAEAAGLRLEGGAVGATAAVAHAL